MARTLKTIYDGHWFWAVGSATPWENGIPSFQEPRGGMATRHVRLWLR
jgi:hypothetical protein